MVADLPPAPVTGPRNKVRYAGPAAR